MFKIIAFFIITLFARLNMWGRTFLLSYGNLLYDRITSVNGQVYTHSTSLTPPAVIEVPVPSQYSESFWDFKILIWNWSDNVVLFFFLFIIPLQVILGHWVLLAELPRTCRKLQSETNFIIWIAIEYITSSWAVIAQTSTMAHDLLNSGYKLIIY